MILPTGTKVTAADGETLPKIGDRITDKSAPPDDSAVREWIGLEAFEHWAGLRNWIDEFYPGVFAPDWLYGTVARTAFGPCATIRVSRSAPWCRNTGCFRSWSWGSSTREV
ncbi:DUF3788 family protein [Mesorhizobium sp. LMG 17147]|uniref:DUF3788 family protein n=1 Tax=Mesorhizobium sp. LMG 17147 TaxID=2963091 RepID=UPI0034A13586